MPGVYRRSRAGLADARGRSRQRRGRHPEQEPQAPERPTNTRPSLLPDPQGGEAHTPCRPRCGRPPLHPRDWAATCRRNGTRPDNPHRHCRTANTPCVAGAGDSAGSRIRALPTTRSGSRRRRPPMDRHRHHSRGWCSSRPGRSCRRSVDPEPSNHSRSNRSHRFRAGTRAPGWPAAETGKTLLTRGDQTRSCRGSREPVQSARGRGGSVLVVVACKRCNPL
jgi:hypothetical protein